VATVLIVEDERKLRELLRSYLERDGLIVLTAATGAEALSLAADGQPDLVVLDLGLPDISGEAVAQEIRRGSATPILMLTARSTEEDRVRGLTLGADDYVTKPFSPREVVLRVRAILRRAGKPSTPDRPRSYGGKSLVIDEARREATIRGQLVELTPTEWGILVALATSPGRVYSRLELINRVRGYEFDGYERSIDSHIKNLRRKIEADPREPQLVVTVLGGGYRLAVDADD
jgi:DNA-binding response OmpR family regulator